MDKVKSFLNEIKNLGGIHFKGLWWHELYGLNVGLPERRKNHFAMLDKVAALKEDLEDAHYNIEMLSGGYSITWNITPEYSRMSNVGVQAGAYALSDWCFRKVEGLEVFDCALTVLTRCISRPKSDEVVFDFGLNSCSDESSENYRDNIGPKFKDIDGIEELWQREELACASCKNASREIRVGDVFEVVPPHGDSTTKMYDRYYGIRDGKVEIIFPNLGRGLF